MFQATYEKGVLLCSSYSEALRFFLRNVAIDGKVQWGMLRIG